MLIQPKRKLSPDSRALAYASKLVYLEDRKRSEYRLKMVQAKIIPMSMVMHQSFRNVLVMVDRQRSLIFVAFRGTAEAEDLVSDVFIALDTPGMSARFRESLKFVRTVQQFFGPNMQIVLTGHSLGGTIAIYVARKLNLAAEVFNPGTSPNFMGMLGSLIRSILPKGKKKAILVNHVLGDPISAFSLDLRRNLFRPFLNMNPHTIEQFL